MATAVAKTREMYGEFNVEVSRRSLGLNLPQQVGEALWVPMFLMAIMAFPAAAVLGITRAVAIDDGDAATAVALGHVTAGVMVFGFTAVLSAIVFAIARILGAFREGGGGIQEADGKRVLTLVMPLTAKAMLELMMMGMMLLVFGIVAEFVLAAVAGGAVTDGNAATAQTAASWSV